MITDITAKEAIEFVSRWHYTGTAVAGVVRYGWLINGELAGVTIYDNGNHAMRQGVFGPDHYKHVVHHHRLAMTDDAPKFSESQFIGASLKKMKQDRPDIWAVVTYADACEGHHGTIYQATNAIYTGVRTRGNLKFKDTDGMLRPTQSLPGTWSERRTKAKELGWTETRCLGKHRYVYLQGTGRQIKNRPPLLWPTEPYPH